MFSLSDAADDKAVHELISRSPVRMVAVVPSVRQFDLFSCTALSDPQTALTLESWLGDAIRRRSATIAFVPGERVVRASSRDNLRYAVEASDSRREASRAATPLLLPAARGYDIFLEGGARFGGQRQRIAIARASAR